MEASSSYLGEEPSALHPSSCYVHSLVGNGILVKGVNAERSEAEGVTSSHPLLIKEKILKRKKPFPPNSWPESESEAKLQIQASCSSSKSSYFSSKNRDGVFVEEMNQKMESNSRDILTKKSLLQGQFHLEEASSWEKLLVATTSR